jgi:hypothetical protein
MLAVHVYKINTQWESHICSSMTFSYDTNNYTIMIRNIGASALDVPE